MAIKNNKQGPKTPGGAVAKNGKISKPTPNKNTPVQGKKSLTPKQSQKMAAAIKDELQKKNQLSANKNASQIKPKASLATPKLAQKKQTPKKASLSPIIPKSAKKPQPAKQQQAKPQQQKPGASAQKGKKQLPPKKPVEEEEVEEEEEISDEEFSDLDDDMDDIDMDELEDEEDDSEDEMNDQAMDKAVQKARARVEKSHDDEDEEDDDEEDDDEEDEESDEEDEESDDDGDEEEESEEEEEQKPKLAKKAEAKVVAKQDKQSEKASQKRKWEENLEGKVVKKQKVAEAPADIALSEIHKKSLFMRRIPNSVTEDEVKSLSKDILSVRFPNNTKNRHSKIKFAFLEFASEAAAEKNYTLLQSKKLNNAPVNVDYCGEKSAYYKERQQKPSNVNLKRLYITNLSPATTQQDIKAKFPFATVVDIHKNGDNLNCHLTFSNPESAAQALKSAVGLKIKDKLALVMYAKSANKRSKKRRQKTKAAEEEESD